MQRGPAGPGRWFGGSNMEEETGSASSSPHIHPRPLQPPTPRTHPWVSRMPAGVQSVSLTLVSPPAFSLPRDHPLHRLSSRVFGILRPWPESRSPPGEHQSGSEGSRWHGQMRTIQGNCISREIHPQGVGGSQPGNPRGSSPGPTKKEMAGESWWL